MSFTVCPRHEAEALLHQWIEWREAEKIPEGSEQEPAAYKIFLQLRQFSTDPSRPAHEAPEAQKIGRKKRPGFDTVHEFIDWLERNQHRNFAEIDGSLRDFVETALSTMIAKGDSQRDALEARAIRLILNLPGRMDFLTLMHQQRMESLLVKIITELGGVGREIASFASLTSAAAAKASAAASHASAAKQSTSAAKNSAIASTLEGIRKATTISGIAAAYELSDRLFDGESG